MKMFRFEHVAGFLIGYDGSWHLKVTASNAYSNSKWPDVWAGKFEDRGGVTKMTVEVEMDEMMKRASVLSEFLCSAASTGSSRLTSRWHEACLGSATWEYLAWAKISMHLT
jgi:hypothetical protein